MTTEKPAPIPFIRAEGEDIREPEFWACGKCGRVSSTCGEAEKCIWCWCSSCGVPYAPNSHYCQPCSRAAIDKWDAKLARDALVSCKHILTYNENLLSPSGVYMDFDTAKEDGVEWAVGTKTYELPQLDMWDLLEFLDEDFEDLSIRDDLDMNELQALVDDWRSRQDLSTVWVEDHETLVAVNITKEELQALVEAEKAKKAKK